MIRSATHSEAEQLDALFKDSIGGTHSPARISDWIGSSHVTVLIDVHHDRVQGAIAGGLVKPEAEIYDVAVSASYRRKGIGAALVSAFRSECQMLGVQDIFLEVRESNSPAIGLYRSLGFKPRGKRSAYYSDGESALVLGWTEL